MADGGCWIGRPVLRGVTVDLRRVPTTSSLMWLRTHHGIHLRVLRARRYDAGGIAERRVPIWPSGNSISSPGWRCSTSAVAGAGAGACGREVSDVNVMASPSARRSRNSPRDGCQDWTPIGQIESEFRWEEFDEPVDRIVSIGCARGVQGGSPSTVPSMRAYDLLPSDGRMLPHTTTAHTQKFFRDNGIKLI